MRGEHASSPVAQGAAAFPSTRWSLVRSLDVGVRDTRAQVALDELCRTYWYPLFVFARRSGLSPEDAEDSTQGFIGRLIEKDYFANAREERGTLRSFLLSGFKNYLINQRKAERREKRGGGQILLSLSVTEAEERYRLEPDDIGASPDLLFERRWAMTILEQVFARLRSEYESAEKGELFEALKVSLVGTRKTSASYVELGQRLGMSAGAVKLAAYRLRQRFRELIRAHIADTVSHPDEINEEILALFRTFAR